MCRGVLQHLFFPLPAEGELMVNFPNNIIIHTMPAPYGHVTDGIRACHCHQRASWLWRSSLQNLLNTGELLLARTVIFPTATRGRIGGADILCKTCSTQVSCCYPEQ